MRSPAGGGRELSETGEEKEVFYLSGDDAIFIFTSAVLGKIEEEVWKQDCGERKEGGEWNAGLHLREPGGPVEELEQILRQPPYLILTDSEAGHPSPYILHRDRRKYDPFKWAITGCTG